MNFEGVKAQILADASPVRRLAPPKKQLLRLVLTCFIVISLFIFISGFRKDLYLVATKESFWLQCCALIFIAITTGMGALRLSIPGLTSGAPEKIVAMIGLGAWFLTLYFYGESDLIKVTEPEYHCGGIVTILAAIIAPIFYGMLLKAAPLKPYITGLLSTIFCTSIGALALHFVCTRSSLHHLLFWHFIPAIGIPVVLLTAYASIFRLK